MNSPKNPSSKLKCSSFEIALYRISYTSDRNSLFDADTMEMHKALEVKCGAVKDNVTVNVSFDNTPDLSGAKV